MDTISDLPDTQPELSPQPNSSRQLEQPPVAPSQRLSLDELVPAGASSAEKRELLANNSAVFSGRCSPAEVRCLLATLEETDLRGLREKLRECLATAIPATAGRPLRNRQSGNVSALADDCWELGYSTAQCQLTRRADTSVLRPAGRTPLPPPGSATELPPGLVSAATVESSLRSVIESQLRIDSELEELRRRAAAAEAQRARIQRLEEQTHELQRACAAAQPPSQERPPAAREDDLGAQTATRPTIAAGDIAAAINITALGKAIADAIHWRAGDSDSENDYDIDGGGRRDRRSGGNVPTSTARRAPEPAARLPSPPPPCHGADAGPRQRNAPRPDSRPQAEYVAMDGMGAPSDLVLSATYAPKPVTKKFIVLGFRPGAPDHAVHDLIQSVTGDLYSFRRLPPNGPSAPAVAYMFEVAESRSAVAMDPSRWPTGLSIRPKADSHGHRRRRFRDAAAPPRAAQNTEVKTFQPSRSGQHQPSVPPAAARTWDEPAATTGYCHGYGEWTTARGRGRARQHNAGAAPYLRDVRGGDWHWHGDARR